MVLIPLSERIDMSDLGLRLEGISTGVSGGNSDDFSEPRKVDLRLYCDT
jgi:hypothetical protein